MQELQREPPILLPAILSTELQQRTGSVSDGWRLETIRMFLWTVIVLWLRDRQRIVYVESDGVGQ